MFSWLFPSTCPCDPAAKAWVEERLGWLHAEFENNVFTGRELILPTSKSFPDPYDGSKESARQLFRRVCKYMDVATETVSLKFVSSKQQLSLVNDLGQDIPGTAGTYDEGKRKFIIRIDEAGLHHPMSLVGTMAHELSHVRLLGEGRIDWDAYDNELLTDLTVIVLGLGIFLANAPRYYESQLTTWPGAKLKKPEYMTTPMCGYALAHVAWWRHDEKPSWSKHLNFSARPDFRQALRFLKKTGESQFSPPSRTGSV